MILRVWRARTNQNGLETFNRVVEASLLPELRGVAGFRGALFGSRTVRDREVEIVMETRWDSVEKLRAFVGEDVEAAVIGSDIRNHLLSFDARAVLFEVIAEE